MTFDIFAVNFIICWCKKHLCFIIGLNIVLNSRYNSAEKKYDFLKCGSFNFKPDSELNSSQIRLLSDSMKKKWGLSSLLFRKLAC